MKETERGKEREKEGGGERVKISQREGGREKDQEIKQEENEKGKGTQELRRKEESISRARAIPSEGGTTSRRIKR